MRGHAPQRLPDHLRGSAFLQIFWFQPGPLGNSRQHARIDFFAIVKCEHIVWPIWTGEDTVGSFGLALDTPSAPQKGGKHLPGFGRRPVGHAGTAKSSSSSGIASPWSSRSAITRRARD